MGMYDEIYGTITCPYCGEKTQVEEQIKARECPTLSTFTVGETITDLKDGDYDWASWVRPTLESVCHNCKKTITFRYSVRNSKISAIDPIVDGNVISDLGCHMQEPDKKVFISLPMENISYDTIMENFKTALKEIEELVGKRLNHIVSYIDEEDPHVVNAGVWYLGKSIERMSNADIIYFGRGWNTARGCQLEYDIATKYGMNVITYKEPLEKEKE